MKTRVVFKRFGKGILASLKWILKIIRQIPGLLGEKPILTALIFLIIIGFIVFRITQSSKQEGKEFTGNIIAEGYGVVFDIFVFGILIAFFNLLGEKRRDIKRWKEEIEDFRYWKNDEAKFRIVGNIKRLNKADVSDIELMDCYLKGAILYKTNLAGADLRGANLEGAILGMVIEWHGDLAGLKFRGANLRGANLFGANLKKADLEGTDLKGANLDHANLEGANLLGANLEKAKIVRANLREAILMGTNLREAILWGTNLAGANLTRAFLEGANLVGTWLNEVDLGEANNISIDQLSKVNTLFRAKLDPELEAQVKEKFPHLLEEFKEGKENDT